VRYITHWNTRPTIVTDEVAKAIHIARYNGEREPDPMGDTDWEYCRRLARAAIAAMPAIVGGECWQPIETAPKDKRAIVGFMRVGSGNVTRVLHWDDDDATWHSDGHDYKPTHWRPLPDPPAQQVQP
jgi:hypothetical protein